MSASSNPELPSEGEPATPKPVGVFKKARAAAAVASDRKQPSRPWTAFAGRALLKLTARIPLRGLHALARPVGRIGQCFPVRETRITRTNIDLCFPELSVSERRQLVRESLIQTACMAAELGHFWLRPVAEVQALVVEVVGHEHLTRALDQKQGLLLACPHLGAWEIVGQWLGSRVSMTALYRAPRVREMDSVYTDARRRSGSSLFPADASGVRAIFQALSRGEVVALLPDQDPGRGAGVFVPFFGVFANTSTLLPRIASRGKASVLIMFAERLPRAAGYRLHIVPGSEEISGPDLERGARALNADIEKCVRMIPAQYLWSYKRFKMRPPGGESLYPEA